jgi:outer membrane lipoprotein-sorting protein
MRSPVSRVAATIIFVLAIGGVALWFHGSGAGTALADFAQPIITAKNAKFKMTTEIKGRPPRTATIYVLGSQHMRQETVGGRETVLIMDLKKERQLILEPAKTKATLYKLDSTTKNVESNNFYFFSDLKTMLRDTQDKPEVKRESRGEKEIQGRHVVGYRIKYRGHVTDLWGDPKSGLPVLVEQTTPPYSMKITMCDFEFNLDLDESLFSTEPPSHYRAVQMDVLPGTEKDLIDALRAYSELFDGAFPDGLDLPSTYGRWITKSAKGRKPTNVTSERESERESELLTMFCRCAGFVKKLPPTSNARYAGKGVSFCAARKPIFWYRPQGAKTYLVIYGDLSVKEAKTPPQVANAQRVPANTTPRGGGF